LADEPVFFAAPVVAAEPFFAARPPVVLPGAVAASDALGEGVPLAALAAPPAVVVAEGFFFRPPSLALMGAAR